VKIDKWKLFGMLGYEVSHPAVKRFHDSEARTKVCCAPRRSTKSYSSAHEVLSLLLMPDARVWVVGPSYGLAEKEFRYIHEALVMKRDKIGLPKPSICMNNARSGQLFIKWPWGAVLEAKSSDRPDSLLGEALDAVIYSEAAQLPRAIRERYIYPTLVTKKGVEIIATTPSQSCEWVYELWNLGQKDISVTGVESFSWDITANPIYDRAEFDRAKVLYGEDSPVFKEQYLGEWVFYGGLVYNSFSEAHVIEPFDIPLTWPRIRGIDFGHRDPFVCLWAAVGPSHELYFYREYYNRDGAPMKFHASQIKGLSDGERISLTVADPESKQSIEDLSFDGITAIPANNDREAGRLRVLEYLMPTADGPAPYQTPVSAAWTNKKPRAYFFNTMSETLREIKFYRWKEGRKVEGEKERTEGEDHAMDVMRYMIMTRPSPFKRKAEYTPYTFDWWKKKNNSNYRSYGL